MSLEGIRPYALPTPEVSPLESAPRPLDYQQYSTVPALPNPERFSFETGSLAGRYQHCNVCHSPTHIATLADRSVVAWASLKQRKLS